MHFQDKYLILTTEDYNILILDLKNENNVIKRIENKKWTHGLIEWDDNNVLLDYAQNEIAQLNMTSFTLNPVIQTHIGSINSMLKGKKDQIIAVTGTRGVEFITENEA